MEARDDPIIFKIKCPVVLYIFEAIRLNINWDYTSVIQKCFAKGTYHVYTLRLVNHLVLSDNFGVFL